MVVVVVVVVAVAVAVAVAVGGVVVVVVVVVVVALCTAVERRRLVAVGKSGRVPGTFKARRFLPRKHSMVRTNHRPRRDLSVIRHTIKM